jgi:Ca2+-transporting ATPase
MAVALAYDRGLGPSGRVEHARALALLVLTLTSAGLAALLSGLRTRTAWAVALATVVLSLVLLQAPPLALALHVEPLHPDDWAAAVAATLLVLSPLAFVGFGVSRGKAPRSGAEARPE